MACQGRDVSEVPYVGSSLRRGVGGGSQGATPADVSQHRREGTGASAADDRAARLSLTPPVASTQLHRRSEAISEGRRPLPILHSSKVQQRRSRQALPALCLAASWRVLCNRR